MSSKRSEREKDYGTGHILTAFGMLTVYIKREEVLESPAVKELLNLGFFKCIWAQKLYLRAIHIPQDSFSVNRFRKLFLNEEWNRSFL